jgi:hypothetical protein
VPLHAFQKQVENSNNPPQKEEQVLETLQKKGLIQTVNKLRQLLK